MIHVHRLAGCAPTPLAHYLKAIGILRLVSEQADPQARGWWDGERFLVATVLDKDALCNFFLDRYTPTPLFNPWGARSGFYPGASEKTARTVLRVIKNDTSDRFAAYRDTIKLIEQTIQKVTGGTKPEDDEKGRLILALRMAIRGSSEDWIDTVTALVGSGDQFDVTQPALFGTGGSEGSGSYTSAYMAAIDECFFRRKWDHAIVLCLFASSNRGGCAWSQSPGQFLPDSQLTPWDLLLAFEGGCLIRSAVYSRNTSTSDRWASSPFFVAPNSYGYSSEARLDEYVLNKGKEMPGRGEQWFPLWSQPSKLIEIRQIFQEGRAATRAGRASDGWSMLRATKSLGVNRGIREFVRYGYQQRNNLATHFAIPLGRCSVTEAQNPHLACLDDLEQDNWLSHLRRDARDKKAPARLATVERQLSNALFAVTEHPTQPSRWQRVLLALADLEAVQVSGTGFKPGPIPSLRPGWVEAADDGEPSLRLALALALQTGGFEGTDARWWNGVRRHWLPLDRKRPSRFAQTGSVGHTRLLTGPETVIHGRSGTDDAIALFARRLIEGSQYRKRYLPLRAAPRAAAWSADLAVLIANEVDLDHIMALARPLMALNRHEWSRNPGIISHPTQREVPDDAWLVLRLALLPFPLPLDVATRTTIPTDPAIFRRLASGDVGTAVALALRRLHTAGIHTAVRATSLPTNTAKNWAAALAFPIHPSTATRYLRRLDATVDSTKED